MHFPTFLTIAYANFSSWGMHSFHLHFFSYICLKKYIFIFSLYLNSVIPWKLPWSSELSLTFPSSKILEQQFLYMPPFIAICELSLGCNHLFIACYVPHLRGYTHRTKSTCRLYILVHGYTILKPLGYKNPFLLLPIDPE